MSEKTEKPSQYKLKKARERGEVSKSADLTSVMALLVTTLLLYQFSPKLIGLLAASMHWHLSAAAQMSLTADTLHGLIQHHTNTLLPLWAGFSGVMFITICLIHLAQSGFIFNPSLIAPKWERLHPKKGFSQIFSKKQAVMLIKALLKFTLSIAIAFAWFHKLIHHAPMRLDSPTALLSLLPSLFIPIFALLLLSAVFDKRYTQWRYQKDQQMTKHEVQEEHKMHEGSPKIKAKIRQNRTQFLQKLSRLQRVGTADVLITNPTHYAIALTYDKNTMPAPKVLFKGFGYLAKAARTIAHRHAVYIVENPPLARALYRCCKENQWIGPEFYKDVAPLYQKLRQEEGA